jgi:hypothetical protein
MPFHTSSSLSLFGIYIYRQGENAERAGVFGGGRRLLQKRTFIYGQIPSRPSGNPTTQELTRS